VKCAPVVAAVDRDGAGLPIRPTLMHLLSARHACSERAASGQASMALAEAMNSLCVGFAAGEQKRPLLLNRRCIAGFRPGFGQLLSCLVEKFICFVAVQFAPFRCGRDFQSHA